jgi:hypothetical protein
VAPAPPGKGRGGYKKAADEKKGKGAGKKDKKKKTVVPSIEAGVGSSTGQTGKGGPEREEDSEAGPPPHRVSDPAWGSATQETWQDYQGGAM